MRASDAKPGMRVRVTRGELAGREGVVARRDGRTRLYCQATLHRFVTPAKWEAIIDRQTAVCLACVSLVEPSGDHRQARAIGGWQPGDELPEDRIRRGRDGEE